MTAHEVELRLRGLPEWLIRNYLRDLGAADDPHDPAAPTMHADGWVVSWTRERAPIAGSLALTEFVITLRGDPAVVPDVEQAFLKKAQRGGG